MLFFFALGTYAQLNGRDTLPVEFNIAVFRTPKSTWLQFSEPVMQELPGLRDRFEPSSMIASMVSCVRHQPNGAS